MLMATIGGSSLPVSLDGGANAWRSDVDAQSRFGLTAIATAKYTAYYRLGAFRDHGGLGIGDPHELMLFKGDHWTEPIEDPSCTGYSSDNVTIPSKHERAPPPIPSS